MDVHAVKESLQETAVEAVRVARSLGAHQAEAGLSFDEGLSVTVRMGELESVERQRDRSLGITVYVDGRKGSATTTQASAQALQETASKALSIASFTTEDQYAGLADDFLDGRFVADLHLGIGQERVGIGGSRGQGLAIGHQCDAECIRHRL